MCSSDLGEIVKLNTGEAFSDTRLGVFTRVLRGKLAPLLASATNLLEGKNVVGQPSTVSSELAESVTPLYARDVYEAIKDNGWGSLLSVGVPGFLGVGVQTYKGAPSNKADVILSKYGVQGGASRASEILNKYGIQ